MVREGSSRVLRAGPAVASLNIEEDVPETGGVANDQNFFFTDYVSMNRSMGLLSDFSQWHGDIFGTPKPRIYSDLGFAVFSWTQKVEWMLLVCAVLLLLLVDVCCLRRFTEDKTGSCTHLALLAFWVFVGFCFNILVYSRQGHDSAIQWCSGYFLEWLLSMDNLFVFHLIFRTYATPMALLHKALFLGIAGAVIFRLLFFMALASLINGIHWFRFVFGALLIYSGIQAARDDDEDLDVKNLMVVRWLKGVLKSRLVERYDNEGHNMFIYEEGELRATMLVPVIFCCEVTDILFAVDSVSAKVAQIPDYYIAYSSSVLAMFGLRAMFFIIHDLVDIFDSLKYGLCFILVFIGIELLMEDYVQLPAQAVCVIVFSVFVTCTAASAIRMMRQQQSKPPEPQIAEAA